MLPAEGTFLVGAKAKLANSAGSPILTHPQFEARWFPSICVLFARAQADVDLISLFACWRSLLRQEGGNRNRNWRRAFPALGKPWLQPLLVGIYRGESNQKPLGF